MAGDARGRGKASARGSGAPRKGHSGARTSARGPSAAQRAWLVCGLDQAGGKLPLFLPDGRRVDERTVRSCVAAGWAEPWFSNPIKPDWLVCRLTEKGREAVDGRVG
jgi:hypothetical protein|uniref:hypothetical protein n=1 Tax=Stappia sp. TaxID=1870903 RepID=UPI0026C8A26F